MALSIRPVYEGGPYEASYKTDEEQMKVTIDVDLTPEEARKLFGLPDVQPMQERMMQQIEKQMTSNLSYLDPETMMKFMMPAGAQGIEKFQELLWTMARSAMTDNAGGRRRGGSKTDSDTPKEPGGKG